MNEREYAQLLRANAGRSEHGEHAEALFLTSSFAFASAKEAAERFAQSPGDKCVYSRFSNPTVTMLNRRIALLEGGDCALSAASGMAALLMTIMALCKSGDKIVCGANVFGATMQLLSEHMARFGVRVEYVAGADAGAWRRAAAGGNTALMLLETPSNPMQEVADLRALAEAAKECGAVFAVDNCFCAGWQQPLKWGADIVIHSGTKYPDGQGRVLGGMIVGGEALLMERIYPFLRAAGPCISPFNAWALAKSLETLPLRARAHAESALAIAEWLQEQAGVLRVLYTGLPSHPAHALAMKQQNGGGGGLVTLELAGGRAAAWRFIDSLRLFSITANFGDTKSIVTHPATTTHRRLSEAQRETIGLTEGIVRLSIGLESADALKEDIAQALAAARSPSGE